MYHTVKIIIALIISMLSFWGAANAAPNIEFSEKKYVFGIIEQGNDEEHIFTFRNTGDEPLNVERIKTSCGCTASSIEEDVIGPNEEGHIKVVYKSKNRSGPFHQKIRVFTNDPDQPETLLTIRGEVKPGPAPIITLDQPRIDLGILRLNTPADLNVSIKNAGEEDLKVYAVSNYQGSVLFEGELSIPPKQENVLSLTYTPKEAGAFRETVFITSNDPRKSRMPLFLNGYADEKEMVILIKENESTYAWHNNTATPIRVAREQSKKDKQSIEPGKSAAFEIAPGTSVADIVFSVESAENR